MHIEYRTEKHIGFMFPVIEYSHSLGEVEMLLLQANITSKDCAPEKSPVEIFS